MGIQGLTTYVSDRSDLLFERYELHDTPLVIDGNALCSTLFNTCLSPNSSFGGDYDHFANTIKDTFDRFLSVGVTPIVVFDGGYERKKLKTTIKRKEQKVFSLERVNPHNVHKYCFPLLMRETFKLTLKSLGLTILQSDFEADGEIAALAKRLNVPVISNDSDFYIFDVLYLPLSSFDLNNLKVTSEGGKRFIECQIYKVDKFLESLGHSSTDKSLLPLLAVLLGNDFISRSTFAQFYGRIKKPKGNRSETQAHIAGLFRWLKGNSVESAYRLVLECLPKVKRDTTANLMKKIIKSYTDPESCLEKYLPPDLLPASSNKYEDALCNQLSQLPSSCPEEVEKIEPEGEEALASDYDEELESLLEKEPSLLEEALWYTDLFRKGELSSAVYTLISLDIFFSVPQIEEYSQASAADISIPLVKILCGLVVGSQDITYYSRHKCSYVKYLLTPVVSSPTLGPFPPFGSLRSQTLDWRKGLLVEALCSNVYNEASIPDDWKLMLLTFIYWVNNSSLKVYNVLNGLMMLIIIKVVGTRLGYFRNKRNFMKKYGSKLNIISKDKASITGLPTSTDEGLTSALSQVTTEDCIFFFDKVLSLFHLSDKLKGNPRSFSRITVHTLAQLQSCIELSNMLNATLGSPFLPIMPFHFINSTLYYNLVSETKRRANLVSQLESWMLKVPSLLKVFRSLCKAVSETTSFNLSTSYQPKKSKRKKKTCSESSSDSTPPPEEADFLACDSEDNEC